MKNTRHLLNRLITEEKTHTAYTPNCLKNENAAGTGMHRPGAKPARRKRSISSQLYPENAFNPKENAPKRMVL